ncbi:MAG: IS1380 family transposase [Nakamurella sp.]
MLKSTARYPVLKVDASGDRVVSHAGSVLLTRTADVIGLGAALSAALAPWCRPNAVHDPGKILLDLAVAVAIGGDCLADIAPIRADPSLFGMVASDPTVSRLIDTLAADIDKAAAAINTARAEVRTRVWSIAGSDAPDHGTDNDRPLVIDLDATLVTAHSEKEQASPNFKRGFGFHPLGAWVDHGPGGTGEPVSMLLRPGNAGSNTAADHITVTKLALRQLPSHRNGTRPGRRVLIRADGGGGTREFLEWLTRQRLSYSIGWRLTQDMVDRIASIPVSAWTAAVNTDRTPRDGAWVTDATGVLALNGWPKGLRVIIRAERPHPGAQLRFTDVDGNRLTAFATNASRGGPHSQHADLELRHRLRARCEDRIRGAKDTGLRNLPLHDFAQNQIWTAVVMLAAELTAWMQILALTGSNARTWEPKRLRHRLFSIAARFGRRGRRGWLRLATHAPHVAVITNGLTRLHNLPRLT